MFDQLKIPVTLERMEALRANCPEGLFSAIVSAAEDLAEPFYISGGAVRDWLRGEVAHDLDLTIPRGARRFLEAVKEKHGSGTIVPLGERHDDTCRLVVRGMGIDASGFRAGAQSIEEDLIKRDVTINGMAVDCRDLSATGSFVNLIDPIGGCDDLKKKVIRACPGAFTDDPLRILRAFRFSAVLDFVIEPQTRAAIRQFAPLLTRVAAERISYECDQVMASGRAAESFKEMAKLGALEVILPELAQGAGVEQPAFHHLDVLEHNLQTLVEIERIMEDPARYFPNCSASLVDYVQNFEQRRLLKWAALFHDVGKPQTRDVVSEKGGRITFHGHDERGKHIFSGSADRLRWKKSDRNQVAEVIGMHMHPFHLCTVQQEHGEISRRARLKMCRKAGALLPALFMLAMADSLAGQGPDKPEKTEEWLADLYGELASLYKERVKPVLDGPKVLTGHDLIATLGLAPGPLFREILSALDQAVIEGVVTRRDEALRWVERYLVTR